MRKMFRLGVVLVGCVWLAGCLTLPAHVAAELEAAKPGEPNAYAARSPVPAAANVLVPPKTVRRDVTLNDLPLASGQIVVKDEGDAASLFVSLFAEDYSRWTHVGIVALEADGPVVYDTNGGFIPVPGLPPTTTFSGGMRRIPFAEYVSKEKIIGIYALPPGVDAGKVVTFARIQYERNTPFDAYFDGDDASALYCSELVALALQAAGSAPIRQAALRVNRSYAVIREWLRLRARQLFLPGQLIEPTRKIAVWSAELSPLQIEAFFEIRRELTRRFDPQTRLGHLFRWTGTALELRDEPQRFITASLAAFSSTAPSASDTDPTDSVRQEVRRLADLHFSGTPSARNVAPSDGR